MEDSAAFLYPNLNEKKAVDLLLSYILNSILVDFHPFDLTVPAINNSNKVDFMVLKVEVPKVAADQLAKYLALTNKKSYATMRLELRRRIYQRYKSIENASANKKSRTVNSFDYPSQ